MKKAKGLVLLIFLMISILGGCRVNENIVTTNSPMPSNQPVMDSNNSGQTGENKIDAAGETGPVAEVQTSDQTNVVEGDAVLEEKNTLDNEVYRNLYIGEVFKSGYIYIEPFSIERGISSEEIKYTDYPNKIEFYPIEETKDYYEAVFDSRYGLYIPMIEEESRYFLQPFSEPMQYVLRYKTDSVIEKTQLGIAILNYEAISMDYSVSGKERPYSESEYVNALDEVKRDKEIEESSRTLDYISLDNTIVGARQICSMTIKDKQLEVLLSKYDTHGFEYAGTVYVIDIIKDGQIINTYSKYNSDGPY